MDEVYKKIGIPKDTLIGFLIKFAKVLASTLLGPATLFGPNWINKYWPIYSLSCALLTAFYFIFQSELRRSHVGLSDGMVWASAGRKTSLQVKALETLKKAKIIQMTGFNLRSSFLKEDSDFDQLITDRLRTERELDIKILIADPDCDNLVQRCVDEDGTNTQRMQGDGNYVLNYLTGLAGKVKDASFEVRIIDVRLLRFSLISAEEKMFITWYMPFSSGSLSPSFEIVGRSSKFFKLFQRQFEKTWDRGTTIIKKT